MEKCCHAPKDQYFQNGGSRDSVPGHESKILCMFHIEGQLSPGHGKKVWDIVFELLNNTGELLFDIHKKSQLVAVLFEAEFTFSCIKNVQIMFRDIFCYYAIAITQKLLLLL